MIFHLNAQQKQKKTKKNMVLYLSFFSSFFFYMFLSKTKTQKNYQKQKHKKYFSNKRFLSLCSTSLKITFRKEKEPPLQICSPKNTKGEQTILLSRRIFLLLKSVKTRTIRSFEKKII